LKDNEIVKLEPLNTCLKIKLQLNPIQIKTCRKNNSFRSTIFLKIRLTLLKKILWCGRTLCFPDWKVTENNSHVANVVMIILFPLHSVRETGSRWPKSATLELLFSQIH
jgi:hypothetical protein